MYTLLKSCLISYLLKKLWDVQTCSREGLDRNSLDYDGQQFIQLARYKY